MSHLAIVATNPAALSTNSAQFTYDIRNAATIDVQDGISGFDDNALFAGVVMPHLDAAYNLAYWLTRNRTDAEEVVQDASLRAFRDIRGFAGGSARAWVLRIVRNTAYSWLHKNHPSAGVTIEDVEVVEAAHAKPEDPHAKTPQAPVIANADPKHLRAAIAALPTPFRETLVLRDIEGLDYREIAEATEVPIGAVMSRLARARGRLIATIGGSMKCLDLRCSGHPSNEHQT
jgi:RNA polymerase sigma-70 factor, ECF subfamily